MTTARAARIRTRVAVIAASLVTLNSIVVLIGWAAGWSIFLTPSPNFIPMAPTTALAFLALSAALGARMLAPRGSAVRNAGTALGWLVASMAIVNIVVPTLLDQALGGSTGQFGRVPLGVMSPVTAAALVPLALAIAAIGPRPNYAGALAALAAIVGGTVALGYAYGTPLLYGGGTIPVALPTGLSPLLLGTATVLAGGAARRRRAARAHAALVPARDGGAGRAHRLPRRALRRVLRPRPRVDRLLARGARRGADHAAGLTALAHDRRRHRPRLCRARRRST